MPQMLQEPSDETRPIWLKVNIAYTKVMVIDNTPINMNNVLIENVEGLSILGTTLQPRRNEESWRAGRHMPNTGISSKAYMPST